VALVFQDCLKPPKAYGIMAAFSIVQDLQNLAASTFVHLFRFLLAYEGPLLEGLTFSRFFFVKHSF
jgi:hypothetical protein